MILNSHGRMASSKRMLANKAHHSREKCLFAECVFLLLFLVPGLGGEGGERDREYQGDQSYFWKSNNADAHELVDILPLLMEEISIYPCRVAVYMKALPTWKFYSNYSDTYRLELKGNKFVLGEFLEFEGDNEDIRALGSIKRSKVSRVTIQKTSMFGVGKKNNY